MESMSNYLRKQAWDYFHIHANQRLAVFNFYVILSSLTVTTYFASFKSDSNLQSARPALAALLCVFAFIFWKLDQRTKFLFKNAEAALKHFEATDTGDDVAKIFTREEWDTSRMGQQGWRRILFWRWHLTYSDCFNFLFLAFFLVGLVGLALALWDRLH